MTQEEPKSEHESKENKNEMESTVSKKDIPKKTVARILGVEISAPEGMKNPMLRLTGLIVINILVLVLLKLALKA